MNWIRTRAALGVVTLYAAGASAEPPPSAAPAPVPTTTNTTAEAARNEETERRQNIELALRGVPGGISLESVLTKALAHSAQLDRAQGDVERADIKSTGARIAFSPRIDLGASYNRLSHVDMPSLGSALGQGNNGGQGTGGPSTQSSFKFPQILDQYALTAGVRVPISDWFFTILPQYRGVNELEEVAKLQQAAAEAQVAYNTRLAYFTYLRSQGFVRALMESAAVLKVAASDLEALVGAGAATKTDLLRTQAALSNAELSVLDAQGQVLVASVQLSRMVGEEIKPGAPLGEQITETSGESPDASKALAEALAERPELEALRKLHEAKERLLTSKRGARYPQLGAVGSVNYANPNPRVVPQQDEFIMSWVAGVALTWSPNDAVAAQVGAKDGEVELRQLEADLTALEDAVAVEVTRALATYTTARTRIGVATQTMEAAQRHYFDQSALLKAGAATTSDVLEAEAEMLHAELAWVDAFVQARMAEAGLLKAQGRTGLERGAVSAVGSVQ